MAEARHFDAQPEAVQELGPELALLGVHGAHQDEAGRVGKGNTLALHHVDPHGRGVQEHVHQVVVQQVHFVDIQNAPVGRGEQTRLKMLLAAFDGAFQIDGAQEAVLGGAQGQIHHHHGPVPAGQDLALSAALPAGVAHELGQLRVAVKRAARHHGDGGQELRQAPGRGGLGGALLAPDQHPADEGIDRVEDEGLLEALLAHQGREGVNGAFRGHRWFQSRVRPGAITPLFRRHHCRSPAGWVINGHYIANEGH